MPLHRRNVLFRTKPAGLSRWSATKSRSQRRRPRSSHGHGFPDGTTRSSLRSFREPYCLGRIRDHIIQQYNAAPAIWTSPSLMDMGFTLLNLRAWHDKSTLLPPCGVVGGEVDRAESVACIYHVIMIDRYGKARLTVAAAPMAPLRCGHLPSTSRCGGIVSPPEKRVPRVAKQ